MTAINNLHLEALPSETQAAFRFAITLPFLSEPWYLAGGTALTLQVGHRSSEDLDFFTPERDFDVGIMERDLMSAGDWETSRAQQGTIYGTLGGAKVSLIAYPHFRPAPVHEQLQCGTIRILPPTDIASMKIIAISQRGRKRDFVDMYWWTRMHGTPLSVTIERALEQFPGRTHNLPHILKSLVYFEDAESDPMPQLNFKADWEDIRHYFEQTVPQVAKELLGI